MARYKHANMLQHLDSQAFDQSHLPGVKAPYAGIYRCTGCGREVGIAWTHELPPENHHQHQSSQGLGILLPIRWQLVVFADHNPH